VGLAREILEGLEECLHAHAGFELPEWVLETRAIARMSALDLDAQAYLDLVRTPRGTVELDALVETVRVGETRFFRHRPHVDALLDIVIPAWHERGERSPRVWSAGCATGEEPYTLALVLARAMPRPSFKPTILATDVSAEALVTARSATYPAQAAESVPEPWRDGLIREGESVRVRPEVTALVTFKQQNLADTDLPRGFDLVWCRNVLIYFRPEARLRVLEKLVRDLEPEGFLFVGYSETLRDLAGLRAVRYADQVLWQKAPAVAKAASTRSPNKPEQAMPAAASVKTRPAQARRARAASAGPPVLKPPSTRVVRAERASKEPSLARASVRVSAADPGALAEGIRVALGEPGVGTLTIDLDTAEYLDDTVAPVLRRASAAAESAGIELVLWATRPGPQRWLRRNGLAGGGE
jgi:chemotaxis protein methyltransferase CheR